MWDETVEFLNKKWEKLIENSKEIKYLNKEEAEVLITKEILKDNFLEDRERFVKPLYDEGILTNIFFLLSPTQGGFGLSGRDFTFILVEGTLNKVDINTAIFAPFLEDIMTFKTRTALLLDRSIKDDEVLAFEFEGDTTYKYFCADDMLWGDITYNSEIGMRFQKPQEKIKNNNIKFKGEVEGKECERVFISEWSAADIDKTYEEGCVAVVNIPREYIENKETAYLSSALEEFYKAKIGDKINIKVLIDGYGHDPRELYVIPEVKEYVKKALTGYEKYLSVLDEESVFLLLLCKHAKFSSDRNDGNAVIAINRKGIDKSLENILNKANNRYKLKARKTREYIFSNVLKAK